MQPTCLIKKCVHDRILSVSWRNQWERFSREAGQIPVSNCGFFEEITESSNISRLRSSEVTPESKFGVLVSVPFHGSCVDDTSTQFFAAGSVKRRQAWLCIPWSRNPLIGYGTKLNPQLGEIWKHCIGALHRRLAETLIPTLTARHANHSIRRSIETRL